MAGAPAEGAGLSTPKECAEIQEERAERSTSLGALGEHQPSLLTATHSMEREELLELRPARNPGPERITLERCSSRLAEWLPVLRVGGDQGSLTFHCCKEEKAGRKQPPSKRLES